MDLGASTRGGGKDHGAGSSHPPRPGGAGIRGFRPEPDPEDPDPFPELLPRPPPPTVLAAFDHGFRFARGRRDVIAAASRAAVVRCRRRHRRHLRRRRHHHRVRCCRRLRHPRVRCGRRVPSTAAGLARARPSGRCHGDLRSRGIVAATTSAVGRRFHHPGRCWRNRRRPWPPCRARRFRCRRGIGDRRGLIRPRCCPAAAVAAMLVPGVTGAAVRRFRRGHRRSWPWLPESEGPLPGGGVSDPNPVVRTPDRCVSVAASASSPLPWSCWSAIPVPTEPAMIAATAPAFSAAPAPPPPAPAASAAGRAAGPGGRRFGAVLEQQPHQRQRQQHPDAVAQRLPGAEDRLPRGAAAEPERRRRSPRGSGLRARASRSPPAARSGSARSRSIRSASSSRSSASAAVPRPAAIASSSSSAVGGPVAKVVERGVADDPVEPRPQLDLLLVVAAQRQQRLREGVLGDVLGAASRRSPPRSGRAAGRSGGRSPRRRPRSRRGRASPAAGRAARAAPARERGGRRRLLSAVVASH